MPPVIAGEVARLDALWELELQYRPELGARSSAEGRAGSYLGSGDGRAVGVSLTGRVRWDLYEDTGKGVCATNFVGFIETDDGARIDFETTGFGLVPDRSAPNRWTMNGAVRFATESGALRWLNSTLAVWQGEFDMSTGRHRYRVYAPRR